jgi:hypothetical protein
MLNISKYFSLALFFLVTSSAFAANSGKSNMVNDVTCASDSKADEICMAIPADHQSKSVTETAPPASIRILAKDELSGGAAPNPPQFSTDATTASVREEKLTNLSIKDAMKSEDELRAVEFYLKSGPSGASNSISTVPTSASGKPTKK